MAKKKHSEMTKLKISRAQKLSLVKMGEASGNELFLMESDGAKAGSRSFFLSAGTHGDEPAAEWLDFTRSSCKEITADGEEETIIRDFRAG